jgi:hypothetical protein
VRLPARSVRARLGGLLLVGLLTSGACSSAGSGVADRPRTPARLEIVDPVPDATTGPDVTVRLALRGARLAPSTASGGRVDPRRGHVHVAVDGRLVAMASDLDVAVSGLTPGEHTVQAEFVATDHLPFANEVLAAVTFRVA